MGDVRPFWNSSCSGDKSGELSFNGSKEDLPRATFPERIAFRAGFSAVSWDLGDSDDSCEILANRGESGRRCAINMSRS